MKRLKTEYLSDTVLDNEFEASTLLDHLRELKTRVIYSIFFFLIGTLICYEFIEHIYGFLVEPLAKIYEGQENRKMIFTGLTEAFFTYLKLAMCSGFILAFPLIAWQIYKFISPGLYKSERTFLKMIMTFSPFLFLLGAALAYYFVFPIAWKFFLSFEITNPKETLPILLEARVSEYLAIVMSLILGFGLAFQLPVILVILCKLDIITAKILELGRKYALIIILIIAAILTPPDVFSQIALAIPLFLLYEISIIICRIIDKNKDQNSNA